MELFFNGIQINMAQYYCAISSTIHRLHLIISYFVEPNFLVLKTYYIWKYNEDRIQLKIQF